MAAVTEDDNPGQLPVAGDEAPGAAAAGEVAGEAGGQDDVAQSGEPDARAEPADAAALGADEDEALGAGEDEVLGADEDEALGAGEDEALGAEADGEAPEQPARDVADLEQESEIAADYLEGLLDVADLDGDIDMDVEGDRARVSVVGATLQELVGSRGEVLEALQELTRLAVHRQTGVRTRIMLDVGGYRARRRMELTALGRDAAEDVSRTGVARRLDPMTPFERKIIHDAVAAAGLQSESEGEEPNRRVVVLPAG
jgi:spoIIIJ-associated protein